MPVRTRNHKAYFTVGCIDAQTHGFTIALDGTVSNPHHDAEQDAVIAALGGQLHPCATAQRAYVAARACFDAMAGIRDVPQMRRSPRRGWTDGHMCPRCPAPSGAPHLATPVHQASRLGTTTRDTETLLRWLNRNNAQGPLPRIGSAPADEAILQALGLVGGEGSRWLWLARKAFLTPRYIALAAPLVGNDPQRIIVLREGGARVEWLAEILRSTEPNALRRLRQVSERFPHSLAAARNVDPHTVADYLNNGVTAHFYTYASHRARPKQILAVYHATGGATTLADILRDEGLTVAQAMRQVGAA